MRCVRPGSSVPPSCGRSLPITQETLLDPTSRTVNRRTLRPAVPCCDGPLPPRILIRASRAGQFFSLRQKLLALLHTACCQLNGHAIFQTKIDRCYIA